MLRKNLGFWLLGTLLLTVGGGCNKSAPETLPAAVKTNALAVLKAEPVTILQWHWVGAKKVATSTNAAGFLALCKLPESKNLEMQTLERLALTFIGAGSNWTSSEFVATNPATYRTFTNPTPLLPILLDLVQEESYCEGRQLPGSPAEVAIAVHLSEQQSQLWQSNFTRAFGGPEGGFHWQLTNWSTKAAGNTAVPRLLELSRAGEYTILGLSDKTNGLAADLAARINRDRVPFAGAATNYWLSLGIDPRRVSNALGLELTVPAGTPAVAFTAIGEADGMRTRAQLDFPESLPGTLEPWKIPTNVIHDPLISFTALRGISSCISSSDTWKKLDVGPAPDQIYFWAQGGLPFISYSAAPASNASNLVAGLSDKLFQANPWLDTNGLGSFQKATNFSGVIWSNLTIMTPFMRAETNITGPFVYAGLESDLRTNRPMPLQLVEALASKTNLVGYDWEFTGPRLEQWLYFGQFMRFALRLGQIPPKSASFAWLTAMTPALGNSVTIATKTSPNQLLIGRKSDCGLTSAELDLLADWLESPHFPAGLNTFLGQPAPLPIKHSPHATNSVRTANPSTNSVLPPRKH